MERCLDRRLLGLCLTLIGVYLQLCSRLLCVGWLGTALAVVIVVSDGLGELIDAPAV